jgi:Cys-rich protein (TIGR01571 family)
MSKNWSYTIFSCCENVDMTLFACFVPFGYACIQCTNAKLAYPESNENCAAYFCSFLGCLGMAYNRAQIRNKLMIEGNFCLDCICYTCCCCCSLVQEWREVMKFKFNNNKLNIFNYNRSISKSII